MKGIDKVDAVLNKTISVSSEKKTYVALSGLKSETYFASIETIDGSNISNTVKKKIIVLK
ncbi:MAG: hypothetical protein PHW02_03025 [bacterium]|nr:hypothetical protein [bacterium]